MNNRRHYGTAAISASRQRPRRLPEAIGLRCTPSLDLPADMRSHQLALSLQNMSGATAAMVALAYAVSATAVTPLRQRLRATLPSVQLRRLAVYGLHCSPPPMLHVPLQGPLSCWYLAVPRSHAC
jgi:hypothetical protein